MKPVNTQAQRLYEGIREVAGEAAAEEVLRDLPLSKAPSTAKKYAWACAACESLEALDTLMDKAMAHNIRKRCACKPPEAAVRKLQAIWAKSRDTADFAMKAAASGSGYTIEADGDALVLVYPRCYCSFVNQADKPLPALWCACSLGYAGRLFAQVMGRDVQAQLLSSVLTGGDTCRIRITAQ